jgi:hypothetical protein
MHGMFHGMFEMQTYQLLLILGFPHERAPTFRAGSAIHDMFHDMFVCQSGLRRAQGAKNDTCLTQHDPQQVVRKPFLATEAQTSQDHDRKLHRPEPGKVLVLGGHKLESWKIVAIMKGIGR